MRYFITFACYGNHLHGHEYGSVDRNNNVPGNPLIEGDSERVEEARRAMTQPPYVLNSAGRAAVLSGLREVCTHRGWNLLAAHVRTTHVHAIVEADVRPERVMN